MSVWFCIPSARPVAEVNVILAKWRVMGYKTAIWRDDPWLGRPGGDLLVTGAYPGYAMAVNTLAREVLECDQECDWIVCGGDDTEPDKNKRADDIARECSKHFRDDYLGTPKLLGVEFDGRKFSTFGVMQPTGDRFAGGSIDRIAGSPWMGREWCLRANQGLGPLYPEFTHMFVDEALKRTAEKLGVYWMRPDLTHMHHHFMRASNAIDSPAVHKVIPPHLVKWNSPQHWEDMKRIFKRLEAEDFAPCMPLARDEAVV